MFQQQIHLSAIYCSSMSPVGLGIGDIYGHMYTFIRRNTTIPTRTQLFPVFTNAYADQTAATIRIFEGEHSLVKYNVRSVINTSYLFECLLYCRYSWVSSVLVVYQVILVLRRLKLLFVWISMPTIYFVLMLKKHVQVPKLHLLSNLIVRKVR